MKKTKPAKPVAPTCEIHTEFCSGEGVRRYRGTQVGDPEFNCCMVCFMMLRRRGVRMKSA
jgi:hypothetical protein